MSLFNVRELEERDFEPAFALVRTLAPDVPLQRWLAYARGLKGRGGILGLFGEDGALFGLLTYRDDDSLADGRVLLVENFLTFELNGSAPGRKALCAAVERVARERGCATVRLVVDGKGWADPSSAKVRGWTALGHRIDRVVLTKPVGGACAIAS